MDVKFSANAFFYKDVKGFYKQVKRRNILNNYPYPNRVYKVKLSGNE